MAETYVAIAAAAPEGMVSLRADLSAARVRSALGKAGVPVPESRRIAGEGVRAGWMSPDELLIFCENGQAPALVAALEKALAAQHHLALDVSDMRAMFRLDGAAVREVLAKLTPADTAALDIGELRRSRLGQVAAAFWLTSETSARVIAFRSVGDYVETLLRHAARAGSEVG